MRGEVLSGADIKAAVYQKHMRLRFDANIEK